MRGVKVLLAVLLVAAAFPPAQGQGASAAILEDASGDMQTMAAGNPVGPPAGRFAATDLVSLLVEETATDLAFRLGVGSLAANPEAPLFESTMYTVDFSHEGVVYRAMMFRQTTGADAEYGGRAYVYDAGRDSYNQLEEILVTADPASNVVVATVPRSLLLDEHGSAPFPGRVLTGFHARSASLGFGDWEIPLGPGGSQQVPMTGVQDTMPDSGNGTLDFPIRLGLAQSGVARLKADVPVRASNGEATTFVFSVNATNMGPPQRFVLATSAVPGTWQVDLPSTLIEIPANSTVTIPVLVSMPFAHQHGTLQTFNLEMVGRNNPADIGRVQLGVRFVQPPQPAGHHDTQYLHTFTADGDQTFVTLFSTLFGFDPNQMYFNTLTPDEDENDAKTPVGGTARTVFPPTVPPTQGYTWSVPLSPGLALGLDFDLTRVGSIKVAVDTTLPMQGAVLTGRLVHTIPDGRDCGRNRPGQEDDDACTVDDFYYGAGTHVTAATIGPSAPVDVGAATKGTLFEAPITATPAGDYLPFNAQATFVLQLNLTFLRLDGFIGPKDVPKVAGGEITLPLLEYHDPVDQVFSSLSSLMITVHGDQQRLVNPGKTALYSLELMNHAEGAASYDLEVSGIGASWAQIVGDRRITVPGGSSRALGVAVTAPAGAADGEASDLVFAAIDTRDPSARTLARLLTTVDTEAEHPDDSAMVPGLQDQLSAKDAPSLGAPLAALALAFLALALRRRR